MLLGPRRMRAFSENVAAQPARLQRRFNRRAPTAKQSIVARSPRSGWCAARWNGARPFRTSVRMEPVAGLRKFTGSPRLGAFCSELLLGSASPGHQRLGALRRQTGTGCGRVRAAVCVSGRSVLADTWRLRVGRTHAATPTASVDSIADGGIPRDDHCPSLGTSLRLSDIVQDF